MTDFWTDAQVSLTNLNDVASGFLPADLRFEWDRYATAGSFAALGDEAIKRQTAIIKQKFIETIKQQLRSNN